MPCKILPPEEEVEDEMIDQLSRQLKSRLALADKERIQFAEMKDFVHEVLSHYNATPDEWEHFKSIVEGE